MTEPPRQRSRKKGEKKNEPSTVRRQKAWSSIKEKAIYPLMR